MSIKGTIYDLKIKENDRFSNIKNPFTPMLGMEKTAVLCDTVPFPQSMLIP